MIKMPEVGKIALNLSTKNKNEYEKTIFISIASYRDPDLINTVKSAYDRAFFKNRLFFSIVSQADESEHPDLSFIPEKQIRYIKFDWRESLGACWAREIASRDISQNYFFQIDSHSRFIANWDKVVTENYNKSIKYWKQDIVYTMHPHGFSRDHDTGEEEFYSVGDHPHYLAMQWDDEEKLPQPQWYGCDYFEYGYEAFYVCANSLFCDSKIIKDIPYDKDLYFLGEEPTLALRYYTRGIKLINPSFHYMWHAYNPNYSTDKRNLHWQDNPEWYELNKKSYRKVAKILSGDMGLGVYGIESKELYDQFQDKSGITLHDKHDTIISKWG